MEYFQRFDASTAWQGWDELAAPAPAREHAAAFHQESGMSSFGALVWPGEAASSQAVENAKQRQVLLGILRKYESAAQISAATLEAAKLFVAGLPRQAPLPQVAPEGEGGLIMAWTRGVGARTLATIDNWSLHWVLNAGTLDPVYQDDFEFRGELPQELLAAIAT